MKNIKRIALVGDFNPDVTAHTAIPKALQIASSETGYIIESEWVATLGLHNQAETILRSYDGVWCIPASPYESMDGAMNAIRYARENRIPFLGTCGGYQHAVLEFTRNVLGYSDADNAEVNPDTAMPLVAPLTCALVEQSGEIKLAAGSGIAKIQNAIRITEKYHCSYGIAPRYLGLFDGSELSFTGFDDAGDPRAFEIVSHPFFFGTAYQPERSALTGDSHPLINAFVEAVAGNLPLAK